MLAEIEAKSSVIPVIKYSRPISEEEAIALVSKKPGQLKFIKGQTPKIAIAAVAADWRALQFVEEQTPELCQKAWEANADAFQLFKIDFEPVPADAPLADLLDIVRRNPDRIKDMPGQNLALCIEAVKQDGMVLRHIRKQTPEIQAVAVANNPMALQYAQNPAPDLVALASALNPDAAKLVHMETETKPAKPAKKGDILYTREMSVRKACDLLSRRPYNLEYFREQTPEMCMAAVGADGMCLRFVKNQTPEICQKAYETSPESAAFVTINFRPDVFGGLYTDIAAVAEDGMALEQIPEQTDAICAVAVASNPDAINLVENKTPGIFALAEASSIAKENENDRQQHTSFGNSGGSSVEGDNEPGKEIAGTGDVESPGSLGLDGAGKPEGTGDEGRYGGDQQGNGAEKQGGTGLVNASGAEDAGERHEQAGSAGLARRGYQTGQTVADSLTDALLVSLAETGRADFDRIGQLLGETPEKVRDDLREACLIFHDPESGAWLTRDRYLSGDVKSRLAQARSAAADNPDYAANIKALKTVIPADIDAADIAVELGSSWVPERYYLDFMEHMFGKDKYRCSLALNKATGVFMCNLEAWNSTVDRSVYGLSRYPASKIIEAIFHNTPIRVTKKVGDRAFYDPEQTLVAKQKADEIRQLFRDWVWTDDERRRDLARIYNERFNRIVPPKYDGSFLELPGMSDVMTPRPHQKNAIWRFVQEGRGMMDHVVGAGKTMIAAATMMERKRMGLHKKPMAVVPNQSHHCNLILCHIVFIYLQSLYFISFIRPGKSGKTGLHPAYLLVYLRV